MMRTQQRIHRQRCTDRPVILNIPFPTMIAMIMLATGSVPLSNAFSMSPPLSSGLSAVSTGLTPPHHVTHFDIRSQSAGNTHRLRFRNGDEDYSKYQTTASAQVNNSVEREQPPQWWKAIWPAQSAASHPDDTSQRVDEYIKFLEKRHHLIHDDDAPKDKKGQSQFLKWLHQEDFVHDDSNALYALGSAAQAGKKYMGSGPQELVAPKEATMKVANVNSPEEENERIRSAVLSLKEHQLFRKIGNVRMAMLRYQEHKLQQLAISMAKILKEAPKVPAWLLSAGGGKRQLKVAACVMSVMLFHVLLPSIVSIARESVTKQA